MVSRGGVVLVVVEVGGGGEKGKGKGWQQAAKTRRVRFPIRVGGLGEFGPKHTPSHIGGRRWI